MSRTDLYVSFEEKEEAKALGARWDPVGRTWYIDGPDPALFERWLTQPPPRTDAVLEILKDEDTPTHRAERFALVTGHQGCWTCKRDTTVSAVLLGAYQEIEEDESPVEMAGPALFTTIAALDWETAELLKRIAPWMRAGYSGTRDEVYLANHCEHCDAFQGAWFTDKPGAVFWPDSRTEADKLSVEWQEVPISLLGSSAASGWHDWLIDRSSLS